MKDKKYLLSGLIALLLLFGLIAPQAAEAKDIIVNAGEALLYLDPAGVQPITNDATQTLQVMVDDVVGLTAFHLELTYEPADITVTAVRNGTVLDSPTELGLFEPTNWQPGDDTGTIMFGLAQQGTGGDPDPITLTEPGVLLEIDFTIDVQSDTTITLDAAKSLLVSWPDAFTIDFSVPDGQGSAVYTLDQTAPEVVSIKAYGAGEFADVDAVLTGDVYTITVDQWYEVDHIEILLSEPVSVAAGAMVWMVEDPSMAYGTIAVDPLDASKLIVEPDVANNRQVAGYVGEFTFEIRPAGSVEDLAGNTLVMNTLMLEVLDVTAQTCTAHLFSRCEPDDLHCSTGYVVSQLLHDDEP